MLKNFLEHERIEMICEQHFRLKKNGEPDYKCYCRHPELIENYDLAVSDETQTWTCHHRLETHFSDGTERPINAQLSHAELVALDMYYDRPAEELIFLTKTEHVKLHTIGKKFSEEHIRKISKAQKVKKVLCIETDWVFASTREAGRATGINNSNISRACNGRYQTAGGYHWKFI